jgi:catechol 2,3-dioxygenase-like lactoylglutathione lyase family enzyme
MDISHIILRVTDMERSVAFYRDAVGLPVLTSSAFFSFFDAGSIRIALNVGEPPDPSSTTEVVLEVDDVLAAYAAMSGRGVAFEVEPRAVTADGSRELHAAHFRDPDGHLWSITGWI